jgi:hypothetical protein
MATRSSRSNTLELPRKSVELQDPGAHDLGMELLAIITDLMLSGTDTSGDDEHFSDASEVPGSEAYDMRRKDAVPDELEVVPEGRRSKRNSSSSLQPPLSPGGTPVPLTVVEKIDPASPSHGEVPGTAAYEQRQADAAPDLVFRASESNDRPQRFPPSPSQNAASPGSIPETIITRADSLPRLDQEPAPEDSRSSHVMSVLQERSNEGKQ